TGVVTITGSAILRNTAGSDGGGIADFSNDDFKLLNSQLSSNHSESDGGGAEVNAKFVTVTNSTVSNNTGGSDGGGLDVDFGAGGAIHQESSGAITIRRSTFTDNVAFSSEGGAIQANGSSDTIDIEDCTFNRNRSQSDGGAIMANGDNVTVLRSHFNNNHAAG